MSARDTSSTTESKDTVFAGEWRRGYGARTLHLLKRRVNGTWYARCDAAIFHPQPMDKKERKLCAVCWQQNGE